MKVEKFEAIQCQRIIITDSEGNDKALISTDVENNPTISMKSDKGRIGIGFYQGDDPFIHLYDQSGKVKAHIVIIREEGQVSVRSNDGREKLLYF